MTERRALRVAEVAEQLGLDDETVRRWLAVDELLRRAG